MAGELLDGPVDNHARNGDRWFAALTKTHQEQIARENLERQEFGVYLPMLKIGRRSGARAWVEVIEPLFPRYLFVRFSPSVKSAAPIKSTRGICTLVRFGSGEPAVVPDHLIVALRARENSAGFHVDHSAALATGDKVVMIRGALCGLSGLYEYRAGRDRVAVLLDVLGGAQRFLVPRPWMERVAV